MNQFFETFYQEAQEHLSALEEALLELEEHPADADCLNTAFRSMHTIKGSAGMVGFDHISEFTHYLEDYFDKVRNKEIALNNAAISLILEMKDHIHTMMIEDYDADKKIMSQSLLTRLEPFYGNKIGNIKTDTSDSTTLDTNTSETDSRLWRVRVVPSANTFKDGFDPFPIIRELTELSDSFVTTRFNSAVEDFNADECNLAFEIILQSHVSEEDIKDVFMFVDEDWDVVIEKEDFSDLDKIGDLLVDSGDIKRRDLEEFLSRKQRIGSALQDEGLTSPDAIESAVDKQNFIREKKKNSSEDFIKVPASKLDKLVNLVGELVIVQSSLDRIAARQQSEDIVSISENFHRLTTELRDTTFAVRMLPIGSTYSRFKRLVRDLARDLGKEVSFQTEGEDTELDKMVLDKLGDPLVHLLRNSLDHGIELPSERIAQDKPQRGNLKISAKHDKGHVLITISDDGRGMSRERILEKAISKGLINDGRGMSDEEVYNLIFQPGFSTAESISDVSGRGVGMDVVKTSIESLKGSVTIKSEFGKGTSVNILLPMTLAIIEGLLVRVGPEKFVVPLNVVEECMEKGQEEHSVAGGSSVVYSRGEYISVISLKELFNLKNEVISDKKLKQSTQSKSTKPNQHNPLDTAKSIIEQIIIVRFEGKRFGLVVDDVIGQHQTVIKSLGRLYRDTPGVMGATILGNGRVCMIIDVSQLCASLNDSTSEIGQMEIASHV